MIRPPETFRQPIRRIDRAHRHAARALEIALSQHCNGTFSTLAWCAAGMPKRGIEPRDHEWYQQARAIVQGNGGKLRPGDADRLIAAMARRASR